MRYAGRVFGGEEVDAHWSTRASTSTSPPAASPRSSRRGSPSTSTCPMRCSSTPGRRPTSSPSRRSRRPSWATAGCGPATRSSPWPPAFPAPSRRSCRTAWCRCSSTCAWATTTSTPSALRAAVGERTRAIVLAHTLGVPFDLDAVMGLVEEHDLWLVEDNCDALGSRYRDRLTGTFGHIATSSFYPAHHITTGEGGMVVTDDEELARIARSVRDWGRDCYCAGGENNTCGKRFSQQFGTLPLGYDHKYVYSHLGYNLKATDMQAAIGCAQLRRLDEFGAARRANHARLLEALRPFEDRLAAAARSRAHRSVVVLLRRHGARGRRVQAQRAHRVPRGQPRRDAQPLQRQPPASPRVREHRVQGRRRPRRRPTRSWSAPSSWACIRASTSRGWTT